MTRSSAIAEWPRDASCQLKSRQLQRNSAETTCTTSPERMEVMKLKRYSKAVCNKHVHQLRSYEWQCKMQKMGWFVVVMRSWGHVRAMPPFDRAHTTSYSTLIEINTKNCCLSIVLTETDQKPQKSLKRWYYPPSHCLDVNVMPSNICLLYTSPSPRD